MSPRDSSLDGNVYTNFFFRIRYPFSASWVPELATNQLQRVSPSRLGNPIDSGTNSANKNLYNLLTLERNFPGHGGIKDFKGAIWLIAENVSPEPTIKSGKECLERLTIRAQSNRPEPTRELQQVKLGDKDFFRQDLAGASPTGASMHETAFFTLTKGYALGFVLTGPNEQAMTNIVATLEKLESF
ncbi:MAG TPA: hypothetical protein VH088_22505 [Terriglobales bacterium]|jgi:hypothetical protein|nr:hypothetical protein [Terriglobales bacterium]